MQPTIEGASPEQRQILLEILAGLGSSEITDVGIRPHYRRRDDNIIEPEPYGDEIFVDAEAGFRRARWEATLLAFAFARRSRAAGLPEVSWFAHAQGGHTLAVAQGSVPPLSTDDIDRFRATVTAAAGDARLEQLDVRQPEGHAFAAVFHVDEPHAYLRFRSLAFLQALGAWRERCDGIYTELRDGEPEPAFLVGWHRSGGFGGGRPDVACCAPFLGRSRPVGWVVPPCPVFG
jgi:hypothetical protein